MSIAGKVAAMLHALRGEDLDELPPAERQRFADKCRHLAAMADRRPEAKAGVLHDLKTRRRDE
jgi:hypothetical protein